MPTLVLSREVIRATLTLRDCVEAVEGALALSAREGMVVPNVVHIPVDDGAFHVKSAGFVGAPSYVAVKVNGNFPNNAERHGLPTIQGAIVLCDGRDGSVLALMDSSEITALRTAAATAIAAKHLASHDTRVATVIGCGTQGRIQLLGLLEILPLDAVYVFDTDRMRSERLAWQLTEETGVPTTAVDDLAAATRTSRAIVTCTTSRRAFLRADHVSPGTFVAAVGADNHDKQELDCGLLARSKVVVDVLEQCAAIGELHHALEAGVMKRSDVVGELGAVVAGITPIQVVAGDIVVFDSTGSAIQDVAAAGMVYERARARGLGLSLELA